MKYLIQFTTILTCVVMLTSCQMLDVTTPAAITDSRTDPEPVEEIQIGIPVLDEALEVAEESPPLVAEIAGPEPDLWQRIRDGFKLDHQLDESRVRAEFDWYAKHPDYLDRVATRASRHLYHIVDEIEARGLPMEFALLPIVESAFDPFAYSHGRASGLWQFIPATGRRYGLKIDYWYDGRRDVPAATTAALDYLEALYKTLDNDWLLALAAYNSGQGNVRYSIRKNLKAGKPTDFWSLGLLKETRAYVPRLLAISALVADPGKYGITLKSIPNKPYWAEVDIGSQLDLAKAAELAEITPEELYLLNPAFNKWSTRPEGPHHLLVPVDKAEGFRLALKDLPANQRVAWIRHQVKDGESLGVIAARYGTTIDTIRRANNIRGNLIRTGHSLVVPVASGEPDAYEMSDDGRLKSSQERVEQRYGSEPQRYIVKSGDSLWDLSREFNVGMRQLAKWNGMATTDMLMPGRELVVFTKAPMTVAAIPDQNEVIRKVYYRVRNGESLSTIANKFNLPLSSIKKWNREVTKRKYIQPGDNLTLYVDVTAQD